MPNPYHDEKGRFTTAAGARGGGGGGRRARAFRATRTPKKFQERSKRVNRLSSQKPLVPGLKRGTMERRGMSPREKAFYKLGAGSERSVKNALSKRHGRAMTDVAGGAFKPLSDSRGRWKKSKLKSQKRRDEKAAQIRTFRHAKKANFSYSKKLTSKAGRTKLRKALSGVSRRRR